MSALNPPIPSGVTVASAPPEMTTSTVPYWIIRYDSPMACAEDAHADVVVTDGPLAPKRIEM